METNYKQFVDKLLHEREKFELLLNRMGFSHQMTMKGVSGYYSIKDLIARTWAYEQYIADRMNEIVHNEPYTPSQNYAALDAFSEEFGYPDFGSPLSDVNTALAWIYERYKNVALEEIVARENEAFIAIITTLETLPEEKIKWHNLFNRVADHTFQHYRDHIRSIRAWQKASAAGPKK